MRIGRVFAISSSVVIVVAVIGGPVTVPSARFFPASAAALGGTPALVIPADVDLDAWSGLTEQETVLIGGEGSYDLVLHDSWRGDGYGTHLNGGEGTFQDAHLVRCLRTWLTTCVPTRDFGGVPCPASDSLAIVLWRKPLLLDVREARARGKGKRDIPELLEASLRVRDPGCWVSVLVSELHLAIQVFSSQGADSGGMRDLVDISVLAGSWEDVQNRLRASTRIVGLHMKKLDPSRARGTVESTGCAACPVLLHSPCMLTHAVCQGADGIDWVVAAPDVYALRSLVEELRVQNCEVTVTMLNHASRRDGMTPHQREVLLAAADLGYFDARRGIGLTELARQFRVSKEALRRTLQRAERRLIRSL